MERTPVEVWQKIFAFSCVDGGRTGCSLSLVSKTFHDGSQRYRYHSVALKGLPAALKFAQLLDNRPRKDLRSQRGFSINSATRGYTAMGMCGAQVTGITSPAMANSKARAGNLNSIADAIPTSVHHLHVTDQFPYAYLEPSPSKMKARDASSFPSKIAQMIYKRNIPPPKDIVQTALARDPSQSIESLMHATLHTILLGAAPTLETLSIAVAFNTHTPAIPPLPVLTELTLNYSFESRIHSMRCVMRTLEAPLPALRMLDLLGLRCHANPEEILYQVAKVAGRNLTHICLPIIRTSNILDMRLEEDHALWGESDNAGLTVHMQSDPWHDRPETALPYDAWKRRLHALDRKAVRGRGRVVLTSRERPVSKCYKEQEENWLQSVIGGRGRWILRQRTPAERYIEQWQLRVANTVPSSASSGDIYEGIDEDWLARMDSENGPHVGRWALESDITQWREEVTP